MAISLCLMNFSTFYMYPFCTILLVLLFQMLKIDMKKNLLLIQKQSSEYK